MWLKLWKVPDSTNNIDIVEHNPYAHLASCLPSETSVDSVSVCRMASARWSETRETSKETSLDTSKWSIWLPKNSSNINKLSVSHIWMSCWIDFTVPCWWSELLRSLSHPWASHPPQLLSTMHAVQPSWDDLRYVSLENIRKPEKEIAWNHWRILKDSIKLK